MKDVGAKLREVTEIVRMTPDLPVPPIPEPPKRLGKGNVRTKLMAVQQYLNELEYNYTGTVYFDVNKNRSHKSIYGTAKEIIQEALPIQCLEAVFVAAYLTAGGPEYEGTNFNHQVDRISISFKTKCGGKVFRHIVLGVKHQHNWGALGLSRSAGLMFKDLKFKVIKIYLGLPFSHDIHSTERVEWRVLNIKVIDHSWEDVASQFDLFAREYPELISHLYRVGELPESFSDKFTLHKPPKKTHSPSRKNRRFEWESINEPNLNENVGSAQDAKRLLLRVSPQMLHFKSQQASLDTSLIEYAPANLFLHNESPYNLVVTVCVTPYLKILGKTREPTVDSQLFAFKFQLKPNSVTSTAVRLILPVQTANQTSEPTDAISIKYVAVEAGVETPTAVSDSMLQHPTIAIPYDWKE
ncbi:hypothetical protein LEN26_000193 [Aphanomyces euteiches]|nr:hypothetical protein LEN26_000193 [Aphanomyces euteiches]